MPKPPDLSPSTTEAVHQAGDRWPLGAVEASVQRDKLGLMDPFDPFVVRAAYDTVAEDYAAAFAADLLQLSLDRQVLDAFVHRLTAAEALLDLGCGPGQVGAYLVERGAHVIGLDLSPQMLRVARRRTGNDRVVCADMRAMPFRSASFSGVVAYYSVHNLPRTVISMAFAETHRILKPGGAFVVATHLGEGEVYSNVFLGHRIETVGGNLYRDAELVQELLNQSFVVDEVRYRDPLPHEQRTHRIYLSCRRVD